MFQSLKRLLMDTGKQSREPQIWGIVEDSNDELHVRQGATTLRHARETDTEALLAEVYVPDGCVSEEDFRLFSRDWTDAICGNHAPPKRWEGTEYSDWEHCPICGAELDFSRRPKHE